MLLSLDCDGISDAETSVDSLDLLVLLDDDFVILLGISKSSRTFGRATVPNFVDRAKGVVLLEFTNVCIGDCC